MAGRVLSFLLTYTLMAVAIGAFAPAVLAQEAEAERQDQVIEPEVERRKVKRARIDTENFEIGAFGGLMSVEDFGTNFAYGAQAAYHITEGLFLEANYGRTDTDKTSFERLSGGADLLSDGDRELTYYNLVVAYNILPGEVFLGDWRSFNSALYLVGGAGSTDFAGDDEFTWVVGLGYRLLASDSVAIRLDVRDHIFETDVLGESDTNHNLLIALGLTFFF